MIISKTPVRVSFFGGGTDYPDYFNEFGGGVLSTTINKYIYVTVNKLEGLLDQKYRITYSKLELCNDVEEINHPVVREVIKYLGITEGLEINIISDLPARTGIGSSSSFTVGLLHALYALQGIMKGKEALAKEAIHIEFDILKERVGVQDQLAAAYGGLNQMRFTDNVYEVNPLIISKERKVELESKLLMFYTGISRFASEVLKEQIEKTQERRISKELGGIYNMVKKGVDILADEKRSLDEFGELMHQAWMAKRSLSSAISTTHLDEIYEKAKLAGAIGGKLLGAGGGGFFVFYVPLQNQSSVIDALNHLKLINFEFEDGGTRIVYHG
jgi:D-glycero-alpha-D-manno-heptose-7-phosphate kinase